MSTQTTPVYGLHQWAGTDPVSRTEMNENFLTLENSLVEKVPHELLYSTTTTANASRVTLTLPTIDWGSYMEVLVTITDAKTDVSDLTWVYVYVNDVQSQTDDYCCELSGSTTKYNGVAYTDVCAGLVCFRVNRNPTGQVRANGYWKTRISTGWRSDLQWQNLTKIIFDNTSSETINAGTVIKVWGVR